jgi:ADP-heptose:LPS heptosyltransferase
VQIRAKQKIDQLLGYFLIALLFPFTRLLGITLRRDHSINCSEVETVGGSGEAARADRGGAPRRIVFIKLMGLGSLVAASDSIEAMRVRFPRARFILVTDNNLAEGIAPFHVFDEIVRMDTGNLFSTGAGMMRFLLRCWGWRGLWVIDLEVYSKLTTVFALLTLARNRFGFYLSLVPFRRYLNTHNITFDQSAILEDNYKYLASIVTGMEHLPLPAPPVRSGEGRKRFIILNNTCSALAPVRKLPVQTFSDICAWVLEHTAYDLALLGAPEDREETDDLIRRDKRLMESKDRIYNYAGLAKDFEAYYGFLREKGVCLVTIDSGPLHIARKLGVPTVSVWGPTDPGNYLKIRPGEEHRHLYFYLGAPCSPCVHRYAHLPCGGDNICMKHIPASSVTKRIQELLTQIAVPQSPASVIFRSV